MASFVTVVSAVLFLSCRQTQTDADERLTVMTVVGARDVWNGFAKIGSVLRKNAGSVQFSL